MEKQSAELLALLRSCAPVEQKTSQLNSVKSDIKHYKVPVGAQAPLFECVGIAIGQSESSSLVAAGFSTLGNLVKRLRAQDTEGKAISLYAPSLWTVLQARFEDTRESYRQAACQTYIDLHPFCAHEIEKRLKNEVLVGSNALAKEMAILWVVQMHEELGFAFKAYTPLIVGCLEDLDNHVREVAKTNLIRLFRIASTDAKNDLKKQLRLYAVRESIVTSILSELGLSADYPVTKTAPSFAASTSSVPAFMSSSQSNAGVSGDQSRPLAAPEPITDPIDVHSQQELEQIFANMHPHFESKETEENWILREKDIIKLKKLTYGNAPSEYYTCYMAGIKAVQEGTLKAANSLRTTLMVHACQLIQMYAQILGPSIDTMVDAYLRDFIKLCSATKAMAVQNSTQTIETLLQYVTYKPAHLFQIWQAADDKAKSKQIRFYAAGWLKTLVERQESTKAQFEREGVELAEKTILKLLGDADPKVKENTRATFWAYAKIFPERGQSFMSKLEDSKMRTGLERDIHNPNASQASFATSTNGRVNGTQSALRDRIAAAKKQQVQAPARPQTAMATMTPAKSKSMANLNKSKNTTAPTSTARIASTASTVSLPSSEISNAVRPSSLMMGAVRRPSKRNELPRAFTNESVSLRNLSASETPVTSNNRRSPSRSPAPANDARSSSVKRRQPLHQSPAVSPTRQSKMNPNVQKNEDVDSAQLQADDFSMVLPSVVTRETASSIARKKAIFEETKQNDDLHVQEDDNLTMVLPSSLGATASRRGRVMLNGQNSAMKSPAQSPSMGTNNAKWSSPHQKTDPFDVERKGTPDRAATPTQIQPDVIAKSISRQGSPLKSFTTGLAEALNVEIYEDPIVENVDDNKSQLQQPSLEVQTTSVLAELPVNEKQSPVNVNNEQQPHINGYGLISPPQSPQAKSEKLRTRKLIQSGIQRIKARTLDTHGFRKVLELLRTNGARDLFPMNDDEQLPRGYQDLVTSLCEFVSLSPGQTPNPAAVASNTSGAEVKRQAYSLLRYLITLKDQSYMTWNKVGDCYMKSLFAALEGRRLIDGTTMVLKDVEGLVKDIINIANSQPVVHTIVAFLDEQSQYMSSGQDAINLDKGMNGDVDNGINGGDHNAAMLSSHNKQSTQTCAFALCVLTQALSVQHEKPSDSQVEKCALSVAKYLNAAEAEVRKAAVECVTQIYMLWPSSTDNHHEVAASNNGNDHVAPVSFEKQGFWNALENKQGDTPGLDEGIKSLIMYYIARKGTESC